MKTERYRFKSPFLMGTLVVMALSGCSTVTYRDKGIAKMNSEPAYESSKSYFLWGLVGEHHIDAKAACNGKRVTQIQAQDTFLDGFLGALTGGIYLPRTAKIWCGT